MSNPNPDEQLILIQRINEIRTQYFSRMFEYFQSGAWEEAIGYPLSWNEEFEAEIKALIKEREELARKETKSIMKMADMYTFEDGTVFVKLKGGKK